VLTSIGNLFSGAKDIQTWLNLCARLITKSIPPERLTEATQIVKSKKGAKSRLHKEQMTSMVWTTPLGLPIVQPYRKTKRKQVMTALQTVFISDPNSPAEGEMIFFLSKLRQTDLVSLVNSIKQASAFPPNFIHSLDATHMMLTALACRVG
jgi:DNA-directed RNA polymerase, mitochondrial